MRVGRFLGDRPAFDQERRAAFQFAAQQIHAPLGLRPVLHHHVFQLVVQELFRRSLPCRIHFDEIGQHAFRAELAGAPVFERGEQLLRRFGRVGVMRQDVLDRFAFGAQTRTLGAQLIDLLTKLGCGFAACSARPSSVWRRSTVTLWSSSCRSAMLSESCCFDARKALDLGGRDLFFLLHARTLALDPGEVRIGLRDLIADGRSFAQQAQDYETRGFDGPLGFAHAHLNGVARLILFEQASANFLHLLFELGHAFASAARSVSFCCRRVFEVVRFPGRRASCAARCWRLRDLRFEASAACARLQDSSPPVAARASVSCASSA